MKDCNTIEEYLDRYGPLLGRQAEASLNPLHVPGRDPLPDFSQFLRKPRAGQDHAIAGNVAALKHQDAMFLIGECGVGKTIASMMSVHLSAGGEPYRVIVMCPGHLCEKWKRELEETIKGVVVRIINSTWDILDFDNNSRPKHAEWYIVSQTTAKLGPFWEPVATKVGCHAALPVNGGLRCPKCAHRLQKKDGTALTMDDLSKSKKSCERVVGKTRNGKEKKCGEPLWQYIGRQKKSVHKWPVSKYVKEKLPNFFDYFILDEAHEEKGEDSAQGVSAGRFAAVCKKKLPLTGTLIGGYANHVRPLLFRFAPQSLIADGMKWESPTAFDRKYGRIERVVTERDGGGGRSNRRSDGKQRQTRESVKPGIMPTLFGRHLLGNSLYLSLEDVSDDLPELREIIVPCDMDAEQAAEYQRIEKKLVDANRQLLIRGNQALLGAMLQALLYYQDYPFKWETVGYWMRPSKDADKVFFPVVTPIELSKKVRPKEQKLLDIIKGEREQGRQVWVFVQGTDTHNVQSRLAEVIENAGYETKQLRSSVKLTKREQWIKDEGNGTEVMISHPDLVKTGLDLFDKSGSHNFTTLIFYETGYNLFTLRQAARRSWRIGQKLECRVYYMYYEGTMQARAMALMGKKLHAAQALEGKFSSEGLVAMGGDDMSVEMALAKSLNDSIVEDTASAWDTIAEVSGGAVDRRWGETGVQLCTPEISAPEEELTALLAAEEPELCPVGAQSDDDLLAFLKTLADMEDAA